MAGRVIKFERFQRIWTPRTPDDSFVSFGDFPDTIIIGTPMAEGMLANLGISGIFLLNTHVAISSASYLNADMTMGIYLIPAQMIGPKSEEESTTGIAISQIALYEAWEIAPGPYLDTSKADLQIVNINLTLAQRPTDTESADLRIAQIQLTIPFTISDTDQNNLAITNINLSSP